ncbi:MAG: DNA methyltransferase, partial [Pseudomonadota bacterium]
MNAVEIEEAISALAEQPFDAAEFPFAFLEAFGNKATTIKRLRKGASNASDMDGGVLQRNNIHIAVAPVGQTAQTLAALKASPATAKAKAKFILATDGQEFHAEDLSSGEIVVCDYPDFPDHFGFFLALAGISTVRQIRESAFDIKATGRLNRLYVELLRHNPEWGTAERRQDMNHFMARLIFLFFAEDTDILNGNDLFTATIDQMSERDGSNMHAVIGELFRAMNTPIRDRASAKLPRWADVFPYVNGGLFSGSTDVPRFSKIARSYLLHIGTLDWKKINPDIFGSMIQAVADDEERGALGMHYTSVPNILKVLNPLFLDDLRETLEEAGDNGRKLLNLRNRMAKIRVFDPACGSGNFLVIAYKQMRAIEAEINTRRGEAERKSDIPLTNFRGIELRDFPAEIARLALIIAEYQCDVTYRGQKEALADFLPLDAMNWITCGNALRLDWLSICPPTGTGVKHHADDLFMSPVDQAEIDFENEGGETYICGNPPYLGSTWQSTEQKSDLEAIFGNRTKSWKSLDYVAGWFIKATDFGMHTKSSAAFVATNSICQGQQVPILWPLIFQTGHEISFAHTSFKWANLASHNAGVTVAIIGISNDIGPVRHLFSLNDEHRTVLKEAANINAYLASAPNVIVSKRSKPSAGLGVIEAGGKPVEGGNLLIGAAEAQRLLKSDRRAGAFLKRAYGASEYIRGQVRYCIWVSDADLDRALEVADFGERFKRVKEARLKSPKVATRRGAEWPHKFEEVKQSGNERLIVVPKVSSETREYLPVGLLPKGSILTDLAFALYDAPLWNMALIASKLHLIWIATVCGKMKTDFRYSNTLGWNTFPVPKFTEKNKQD